MRTAARVIVSLLLLASALSARGMKAPDGCAASRDAKPGYDGYANRIIHEKTGIEMVLIPAGEFEMSATGGQYPSSCQPGHKVTFAYPFYIGKTEVTNGQYKKFVESGYDGSIDAEPVYDLYLRHLRGKSIMPTGDDFPVVWVSWKNAKAFCNWAGLDLPSESEWEYACRAGTSSVLYFYGEDPNELPKYAWLVPNSGAKTNEVAKLLPNPWGLYDVYGNVWEWTLDDFVYRYEGAPTDGSARIVEGRLTKVLRGGGWSNGCLDAHCSSITRFNHAPANANNDVGFRVVLRLK